MMRGEDLLSDATAQGAKPESANDVANGDWDEEVRLAFFGCMAHEIRAESARRELVRTTHPGTARELNARFATATEQARAGWATIDRCLAVHGELAALALDRCIEETSLQLRRPSGIFTTGSWSPRPRSLVAENETIARSSVDRARERLTWFRARRIGA
jgi:hypothetical protein